MPYHDLVLDTNVYYTFCGISDYKDLFDSAIHLMYGILDYCEHRICWNDGIAKEFEKLKRDMEYKKCNKKKDFEKLFSKIQYRQKIQFYQPYTPLCVGIHSRDEVFYQTCYNTNDKVFITCEDKHLSEKERIKEEHGIIVMDIKDAVDLLAENHSRNTGQNA